MSEQLCKYRVRKIMKEIIKDTKLKKESVEYMADRAEQFIKNLTRNSMAELKNDRHTKNTLRQRHIQVTLASINLAIKNLPSDVCGDDK